MPINGERTTSPGLLHIVTARSISDQMRPGSLDVLGLGTALALTLERFGHRHGVQAACSGAEAADGLPAPVATQIFRIVQEGLTNVARHAQARQVEVSLARRGDALEVRLCDDGRGIDLRQRRQGSMGLFSMQERARDIGAMLEVGPRSGGGTELRLLLPLAAPAG